MPQDYEVRELGYWLLNGFSVCIWKWHITLFSRGFRGFSKHKRKRADPVNQKNTQKLCM